MLTHRVLLSYSGSKMQVKRRFICTEIKVTPKNKKIFCLRHWKHLTCHENRVKQFTTSAFK